MRKKHQNQLFGYFRSLISTLWLSYVQHASLCHFLFSRYVWIRKKGRMFNNRVFVHYVLNLIAVSERVFQDGKV